MSGKIFKKDVSSFEMSLFNNISQLHKELSQRFYCHDEYIQFKVNDQKPRDINKASVKDRLVHRLMYDTLYNYFDKKFIFDSFSCRKNKGVHKAILRYKKFSQKISKNHTKQAWVLKCDIKKCFASVDQEILIGILSKYIEDKEILSLLKKIILSFKKGLPLGNLTSQLFINIYLHELDIFVKKDIKQKYYIRYADDFVIFSENLDELNQVFNLIKIFLKTNLKLEIHPRINIKTIYSGISFLGWKHFPQYRILRNSTRKRAIIGLKSDNEKVINSYLGLLKWGSTYKLKMKIIKEF